MAQAMGLPTGADIPAAIQEMNARLGLPASLTALEVKATQFPDIVRGALADHCHKTNPREASAEDYEALLAASL